MSLYFLPFVHELPRGHSARSPRDGGTMHRSENSMDVNGNTGCNCGDNSAVSYMSAAAICLRFQVIFWASSNRPNTMRSIAIDSYTLLCSCNVGCRLLMILRPPTVCRNSLRMGSSWNKLLVDRDWGVGSEQLYLNDGSFTSTFSGW